MIIRGVLCEVGKPPVEAEIDTQYLDLVVGANRMLIRPFKDRNVGILVNENYESDRMGLKYNRSVGSLFKSVSIYGNLFVAALDVDGSLLSLNDQQMKLYLKQLAR